MKSLPVRPNLPFLRREARRLYRRVRAGDAAAIALAHAQRIVARVRGGDAPARWLAQLVDRADCLAGSPVRYGLVGDFDERGRLCTGHDVVDPSNLDLRRAGMGLEPIELQRRWCVEAARARGEAPYEDRDAYEAEKLEIGVRGGWR